MTAKKLVTNEDILELLQESMQISSDGFEQVNNHLEDNDERLDAMQAEINSSKHEIGDLKKSSYRQELEVGKLHGKADLISGEIKAIHTDINEILHRLVDLESEKQESISNTVDIQTALQNMLDKIKIIAEKQGVQLKF